jgi:hypothetical protein
MQSHAADKPVPRDISAQLSDEPLIPRETQRAVTPFGGIFGFHFVSGQDRLCGNGSEAHADPLEVGESHRAEFQFHSVPDTGSGGRQTLRSCRSARAGIARYRRCWAWIVFPPTIRSAICFALSPWTESSASTNRWGSGNLSGFHKTP